MPEDFRKDRGDGTLELFTLYLPGATASSEPNKSEEPSTAPRLVCEDEEPPPLPAEFRQRPSEAERRSEASQAVRHITDVLAQALAFYPITSVTYSQSEGESGADFEAHDPVVRSFDPGVLQDMEYISRAVQAQLHGRYIYVLVDSNSLTEWFATRFFAHSSEFIDEVSRHITGKRLDEIGQRPFVVTRAFFASYGFYCEAPIQEVRELARQGKFPSLEPGVTDFRLTVYNEQLLWAYGSPFPLTEQQIAKLETVDWPKFSKVAVGPNVGVKIGNEPGLRLVALEDPGALEPGLYASGIPVVDPLLILENLTKKYAVACDDVHSHLGRYEDEKDALLRFRRYEAAIGVLPLFRRAEDASSAQWSGRLEWEIKEFEKVGERLAVEAEMAAESLIGWLSSEPVQFIEELAWSCPDDKELRAYEAYAKTCCQGLQRLGETNRGKAYVGKLLDELEDSSPPARGGAKVLSDFVLPPERSTSDAVLGAARNISGVVAETFGVLVPAIVERILHDGYVVKEMGSITSLSAIDRVVQQLNAALGETLLSVEMITTPVRSHLGVSGSNFRGGQGLELQVERPRLRVTELQSSKVGAAITRFTFMLDTLNAVLLVGAIRESLKRESRDDMTTTANALRLAKSVMSMSAGYVTLQGVNTVAMRKSAAKLAGRLAIVGTAIDLLASTGDAVHNFRTGDGDAAAGNIVSATGAGVIIAAFFLSSNPAGWVVAGILLGVAGSSWASAFEDTPFDKLYEHSPFGRADLEDKLEADDPAWTLTTEDYTAWDRNTPEGVEKFLSAAQQLQFAFSVRGAMPSSPSGVHIAAFEITVQELLAESTFHIEYEVTYAGEGVFSNETKEVSGYLWLMSLRDSPLLADYPSTPDPGQTNFEMAGVVEINGGVIKVNLRPTKEPKTSRGGRMKVWNVTLRVRLDVHGDAYESAGEQPPSASLNRGEKASLVVPTTAEGKRWVTGEIVERERVRLKPEQAAQSYKLNDLA